MFLVPVVNMEIVQLRKVEQDWVQDESKTWFCSGVFSTNHRPYSGHAWRRIPIGRTRPERNSWYMMGDKSWNGDHPSSNMRSGQEMKHDNTWFDSIPRQVYSRYSIAVSTVEEHTWFNESQQHNNIFNREGWVLKAWEKTGRKALSRFALSRQAYKLLTTLYVPGRWKCVSPCYSDTQLILQHPDRIGIRPSLASRRRIRSHPR